jgi:hypothetical protein
MPALGMLELLLGFGAPAGAQSVLLDEVHTIAASGQAVPIEHSFNVATAGTYTVTLTDLGAAVNPGAALASVQLAITSGNTIVGTPLNGAGTTSFTATTGAYVVRVTGMPGDVAVGSGPFGVQITNTANNAVLAAGSFSDTLTIPAAAAPSAGVLSDTFTVSASDTYQISLSDQQFPLALNVVELALTAQGSSSLLANLAITTANPVSPQSAAVPLQPNTTYSIVAFGQLATGVSAGLYNVVVRDSQGDVVYSKAVAVGATQSLGSVVLTADTYTLSDTDLNFPAPLASTGNAAIVLLDDQPQAKLTATGTHAFMATAGTYRIFALGTPNATAGAGSYDVELLPSSGPSVFSSAQAVTVAGSAIQAYSYSAAITTAGSYNIQLVDFKVPQPLSSVSLAAVQAGASLATPLNTAGSLGVSAASGPLSLLVFAQASAAGGESLGLFGVSVSPTAGGAPIFDNTQGLGSVFITRKVNVATAGNYLANVTDVGFPVNFTTLYTVVTQGSTVVGQVFGSGSLPFMATTGDYFFSIVAQPSSAEQAGTYAINVAPPPPAPVVSLAASASSVASGGSVNLTWSSQNDTTCAASGGWSGTQPLSGSASTGALTATTTFTLSCTGAGGTTAQSVMIAITQSSRGGGGALDPTSLLLLAGFTALRNRRAFTHHH